MATVRIRKSFSGGGDPRDWVKEKIQTIEQRNESSMRDTVAEGAEIMRDNIETSGTAHSGKRGRVETGRMLRAVGSQVKEAKPGKVRGSFGWLNDKEDYFRYQNEGFRHIGSGRQIEGMYALSDAAEEVWQNLLAQLKENAKNA